MPWITPTEPPASVAACRPLSRPSPPASKPYSRTPSSGTNAWNAADGVGPAADAGDDRVGQRADQLEDLPARLDPDDALEVADHHRERVRAHRRADAVVGVVDAGHPVAERLVAGVLEGAAAGLDRDDLGAEHAHAGDVERLAHGVDLAHVDGALQAEQRRRGGGRDAVLAGAGLGDHARSCPCRWVSSAWPSTLLILWEPVWLRSSRLSRTRTPPACSPKRFASVSRLGRPA